MGSKETRRIPKNACTGRLVTVALSAQPPGANELSLCIPPAQELAWMKARDKTLGKFASLESVSTPQKEQNICFVAVSLSTSTTFPMLTDARSRKRDVSGANVLDT